MKNSLPIFGLLTSTLLLTACSGGSGGASVAGLSTPAATPSAAPTSTASAAAAVLGTAVLDGAPAFVNGAGFAVYEFGDDATDASNCTGGCLAAWPAVTPPAGALVAPWSSFKRADNGQPQLAYSGHPLYTFKGDAQPGVATGNGLEGFTLARPL